MSLRDYFKTIRAAIEGIENHGFTDSIEYDEQKRFGKQAVLTIKLVFINGNQLFIKEYIDWRYGINRVSYAYHYQNNRQELIFRYDNAKHRPLLEEREHKHFHDGAVRMIAAPNIEDLLYEAIETIESERI